MKKSSVTIHDIAKKLNISASTVSRALADNPRISDATKEKVKALADKMHYYPNVLASSLRKGKGNVIGVIVPRINRHFFSNVIEGIEREAREYGYNVIISQSQEKYENEVSYINALLNARVDGVIVSISVETNNYEHLDHVIKRGIPIVFFDRIVESLSTSYVELDDFSGAFDAVSHLIEQGCKRIVFLGGLDNINIYKNRKDGYVEALKSAKLSVDENLVFQNMLTREQGHEAIQKLIEEGIVFDGVFASSDFSALGALLCLKGHNIKIPEDVAVAGFANEPFTALMEPPLTSVEQYGGRIGTAAVKLLFDQIEAGNTEKKKEFIKPKLLIRKSSFRK